MSTRCTIRVEPLITPDDDTHAAAMVLHVTSGCVHFEGPGNAMTVRAGESLQLNTALTRTET